MKNNQFARVCVEIVVGIVISVLLSAILIAFGYYKIKSSDLSSYNVSFIGFDLYKISKSGGEYVGQALNQNMSIIGIIWSMVVVLVNETRLYIKSKKIKLNK
ncbi:LlsX family protein [Clostridium sp. MSJ-8]|uniref:LlsX family protein n=1 Tax=Clostridium sp. MSJ-8 TaxID=2841510 RepID=UPI001C0EE8F7|nr:LlsX family protein [Clostridium sp. MSJ-8]MBU5487318.1 LlsX family protein [Clostridium sp. MSJ-8]